MTDPKFAPGTKVIDINDRSLVGVVTGDPSCFAGEYWYSVFLSSGADRKYPESSLETFTGVASPRTLLLNRSCAGKEAFSRIVTYTKLSTPLQNSVYSLRASRTHFYPFQFKPLVKFLDSPKKRLLISDEVGLGKTIEAGLILTEQRARHRDTFRRVLIVCPSSLCTKWREEMMRRFDEEFSILNARDMRDFIANVDRQGEGAFLRGICSLQMLRSRGLLDELRAASPPFDLVIVDEAHHMRNQTTLSFQLGSELSECTDAMICLTATPVQTGNENLFNLLRILDPDEFDDFSVFARRVSVNAHILDALRVLRRSPVDFNEVGKHLRLVESTSERNRFLGNPIYRDVLEKLETFDHGRRDHVVELQKDISSLNVLSHILTRTRKSEVHEKRAKREARVVQVQPSPQEREFYDRITDLVRQKYRHLNGTIGGLAAITVQRQLASCMPAMAALYAQEELPAFGGIESELSSENLEDWGEDNGEGQPHTIQFATQLRDFSEWANGIGIGSSDSKFDALLTILTRLSAEEPDRKLIVFTYFKHTIRYLAERLKGLGYKCLVLSGDVPSRPNDPENDERGKVLRRFRNDPSARILISTEVGSEGLDFEFCHALVNYDLPWNPMVVEQRIGRLDRITQKSEKILIYNLAVPGTIEERILDRLYLRIGIFEESIGDLEAILGEEIKELTNDLFTNRLSPAEQEQRIDKVAEIIELRRLEMADLEKQSERFIGHDEYFNEEIERIKRYRRYVSAEELEVFLREFLSAVHPACTLASEGDGSRLRLKVTDDLYDFINRASEHENDPLLHPFLRKALSKQVVITFDSEAATDDPEVEYVSGNHPLVRAVKAYYDHHRTDLHPVSKLTLPGASRPGVYLYALYLVEINSASKRITMESVFLDLNDGSVLEPETAEELLTEMTIGGTPLLDEIDLDPGQVGELLERAETVFIERLLEKEKVLKRSNDALINNRLSSLEASFRAKESKKTEMLEKARILDRTQKYIRMLEGGVRNVRSEYARRKEEIDKGRIVSKNFDLIAAGFLNAID